MKSKRKLAWTISALILSVTLGAGFFFIKNRSVIQQVSPKRGLIVEAIYGIGTVTPRRHFAFRLSVATSVTKAYVHEGQIVEKNQPLVQLDPNITLRAPFKGTVTSFPPDEGENVFPDQPVAIVQDLNDPYIVATIDQQSALRVKRGMPVRLSFETLRNQTFQGVVESLYPSQGQFMVRVEAPSVPDSVLPGMTADTSIQVAEKSNALLIPVLSIFQGKVIRERNGHSEKIGVKIGISDSEWAEVLEGDIQESDKILVKR